MSKKKSKKGDPGPKRLGSLFGTLNYNGNVVDFVLGETFYAQRVYQNDVTMVRWVATHATYDKSVDRTVVELDGTEYEL